MSQGGFVAEVTAKKEMVNLQHVFENKAMKTTHHLKLK